MAYKVVFFGSIGIAKRILEEVILSRNIELLGVCCEKSINPWRSEESVYDFAIRKRIPILELNDVADLHADLGISVRFNKIIRENVITSFKRGIVNTHGGILPEYRGSYCNINAIINGEELYGVTLHYIQPGVDDGDIVDIASVAVGEEATGFDLYHESERLCYEVLEKNIDKILAGTNKRITQQKLIDQGHICRTYKRDETIRKKDLTDVNINDPQWIRIVRAFDSPYHEPAYIRVGDRKVYVRYKYGMDD